MTSRSTKTKKPIKKSKYKAVKTEVDGIKFDSKKEANRHIELKKLEKANVISSLKLQVKHVLQPKFKMGNKTIRAITYVSDFEYYDEVKKEWIIEDVKGMQTDIYKLKKKMFMYKFQTEIHEV